MTDIEYYSKVDTLIKQFQKRTKKVPMPARTVLENELREMKKTTILKIKELKVFTN